MNLFISDPYEKAFGLINAYKRINKHSQPYLKSGHPGSSGDASLRYARMQARAEKRPNPFLNISGKRRGEMRSIMNFLSDDDISDNENEDNELSESIGDSIAGSSRDDHEDNDNEDSNHEDELASERIGGSHPRTSRDDITVSFISTDHSDSHTLDENELPEDAIPLNENIMNEYFDEYNYNKPVGIILEKKSKELLNDIYERKTLMNEGKEVPDDYATRIAIEINGKNSIQLKDILDNVSADLRKIEKKLGNSIHYSLADLKNSVDHEGEGEFNVIQEISDYDKLHTLYLALESIIDTQEEYEKMERAEKLKEIVDNINKKVEIQGKEQEANDYINIVGKIAEEFKNKFDTYSTANASGTGKPNKKAYEVAVKYVKQLSQPGNISISEKHIGVLRRALPKIRPQLIYKYLDNNILMSQQLIKDMNLLSELDDLKWNDVSASKKKHGFTLSHNRVLEHIQSSDPKEGFLKAIWDD